MVKWVVGVVVVVIIEAGQYCSTKCHFTFFIFFSAKNYLDDYSSAASFYEK